MSGHSKWATTHRQKEANDAKKGAVFTKLAAVITVAVKQGGGVTNPDENFKLRLAVDRARQVNMPKENIQRAIEKGSGTAGGAELTENMYEGFLPGGASVLVETLSDNKLRTSQEVRITLDKNGGSMGSSGSVSYMYSQKGQIIVDLAGKNPDEAELQFIDAGAEEMDTDEGKLLLYCDKDKTFELKQKIEAMGYKVEAAELTMKPTTWIDIEDGETRQKAEKILDLLEELEDVTHVWTNYA